jgi:hypothetical protein
MNIIQRYTIKMIKPMAKRLAKKLIKDNQELIITQLKHKVDIPKLTPVEECVLWNRIYDNVEDAAGLIIDRI